MVQIINLKASRLLILPKIRPSVQQTALCVTVCIYLGICVCVTWAQDSSGVLALTE